MSARASRLWAGSLATSALILATAAIALAVRVTLDPSSTAMGTAGFMALVLGITYPLVGWLIASRRPGNSIGWIFLLAGLAEALEAFCTHYATYGLITAPGSLPLADVASWVAAWVWVPGVILIFLLVMVFPDGHLPSRRWRPAAWLGVGALALELVPNAIAQWSSRGPALLGSSAPDPAFSGPPAIEAALGIGGVASLVFALLAMSAIVLRFGRSSGVERQQIKWFGAAGIAVIVLLWIATGITLQPPLDALVAVIVAPLLPIATAVAILRYRLYEIDRIISRTIGYAIVTGILAVVFVGAIVAFQALLAPVLGENPVAVAGSTLVVAALFQPLRSRVQRIVDRHFDRSRYDAERTLAAFASRLRDDVDLDSLGADIGTVVRQTVVPTSLGLWLHARGTRE